MVFYLCNFFMFAILLSSFEQSWAQSADGDLLNLDLAELMEVKVVSASKSEKLVEMAPSIITVYTDKDIQRMGARSVKDLLERTVGFHIGQQFSNSMVGNRGIIADGNSAWLMLIDGHNVNNTSMHGMQSQYIFPLLHNVKRVEIVRGPGSTLWGSDAALGIIHIITKDGTDSKNSELATDFTANEEGKEFEQHYSFITSDHSDDKSFSYMTSFDWMKSAGYPDEPNLSGLNGQTGYTVPFNGIRDSHQLFTKFRFKKSQMIFRKTDLQHSRLWTVCCGNDTTARHYNESDTRYNRQRTVSGEFIRTFNFADESSLELKMFGGVQDFNQQAATPYYNGGSTYAYDLWSHEFSYGTELLYSKSFSERVNAKFGTRLIRTEYDPIMNGSFDTTAPAASRVLTAVASPPSIDESNSAYVETDVKFGDSITTTAGLRHDSNRVREKGSVLLPRFGVIYKKPESDWSAKYLYNTGFVRPPTNFNFFGTNPINPFFDGQPGNGLATTIIYGADKAEEIQSHDLQFTKQTKATQYTVTLYQTRLENYFLYSGEYFNAQAGRLWIVNSGAVTSRGVELEARHNLNETWRLNGNLSYIISSQFDTRKIKNKNVPGGSITPTNPSTMDEDKSITGFPQWIANFGFDYALSQKWALNSNVHLISGGVYEDNVVDGKYRVNDTEATLDVAATYANSSTYSLSFIGQNITDNTYRVGAVTGGAHQVKGLTLGVIGKYEF